MSRSSKRVGCCNHEVHLASLYASCGQGTSSRPQRSRVMQQVQCGSCSGLLQERGGASAIRSSVLRIVAAGLVDCWHWLRSRQLHLGPLTGTLCFADSDLLSRTMLLSRRALLGRGCQRQHGLEEARRHIRDSRLSDDGTSQIMTGDSWRKLINMTST